MENSSLLLERLRQLDTPPWRPIPSRSVARLLGVSLQTLANWRVRESGPPYIKHIKRKGNRSFYRSEDIIAWLESTRGGSIKPWEVSAEWLARHHLDAHNQSEATTKTLMQIYDECMAPAG